jgi:hypothetical protein
LARRKLAIIRRAGDQFPGEPRGVFAQSLARIRLPISPPPENKKSRLPDSASFPSTLRAGFTPSGSSRGGLAVEDFTVQSSHLDSIESYDAKTGAHLGNFVVLLLPQAIQIRGDFG